MLALVSGLSLASCDSNEAFVPPEVDVEQITAACASPPSNSQCPGDPEIAFKNGCSPFLGSETEPELEVDVFSNFHCPHCAMFASLAQDIFARRSDLERRVRIYFHHYPFNVQSDWDIHAAAHAAKVQGDGFFWAAHDEIYGRIAKGKSVDTGDVVKLVRDELGLDMVQFDKDRKSNETMSFLSWDRDQGASVGVSGTPSVYVCGQPIDWRTLEQVLDGLLGLAPDEG